MSEAIFDPTAEQRRIISHDGSAFIAACPGAGKTRVMVERARHVFPTLPPGRGIAFLSFTRSAISELEIRLRQQALLPSPAFPSFIGTFDSFVWQFLIAPFGLPGSDVRPRLIPDMKDWDVVPFNNAQVLPLSCFCPSSGGIDQAAARRKGFDVSRKPEYQLLAYSRKAITMRAHSLELGMVGFDEARLIALERINTEPTSSYIAAALCSRFSEVIVDEAQDCNPDDLRIVSWLRGSGIPIKVICDPHQSIYGFRGGVTDELFSFADEFTEHERKPLHGNFRSSSNICKATAMLRPPSAQNEVDEPLGKFKDVPHSVHVLSYAGTSVPSSIGPTFCALVRDIGEDMCECPVLAATRPSGAAAVGAPRRKARRDATLRLAIAVMDFHFPSCFDDVKSALEDTHRIILEIENLLSGSSYHKYLSDNDIKPASWRPRVMQILRDLRFDPAAFPDVHAWHDCAKSIFGRYITLPNGVSISQKLKWNPGIETLLSISATESAIARTIHSVKGLEYPTVCVVTTAKTLKGILDYLETGAPPESAEEARELYVAASRAQKLLVFAAPRSQASRFSSHLRTQGAEVTLTEI
jgi:DNA helicase II / ATP-dependent DNA helicase PcrA